MKRAKRHEDGVPYPELLWKFKKRDWHEYLATTGETCQRHVDGLSQRIALPYTRSWLFLKTCGETVFLKVNTLDSESWYSRAGGQWSRNHFLPAKAFSSATMTKK